MPRRDYTDAEIFERDNWTCIPCGQPIDRSLRSPHRMSASIDHIVPTVRGGKDVKANVQAAHRKCNSSKGKHDDIGKVRRVRKKVGTERGKRKPVLVGRDGVRLA